MPPDSKPGAFYLYFQNQVLLVFIRGVRKIKTGRRIPDYASSRHRRPVNDRSIFC